ncbi:MAG: fatty acid desaturase [Deltaproteobacteria bacterium]|nr:fatty acid desaturase [Deltaproteobacteria bacterium]
MFISEVREKVIPRPPENSVGTVVATVAGGQACNQAVVTRTRGSSVALGAFFGYATVVMAEALVLTDPTEAPRFADGPLSRWCRAHLYDPRDEVFVRLTLEVLLAMGGGMALLGALLRTEVVPPLVAATGYLALWGWYSAPVILMLHNTMHRPFLRRPKWLDFLHPYVMSLLLGIPTGYGQHHLGMHHVEDNLPSDLSSTMRYRRDSFVHFLVYFGRFFLFILGELTAYLLRKRRTRMARRAFGGELVHLSVVGAALWVDWRFGLVAFAIPTFMVRFLMMVGNWGQHAFLNVTRDNDGLSNSITCINSGYNQRAFNDGYHIGHHLKASRHWTEMPQDLLDNVERYARAGAIVFRGIDFFLVSLLLWTGSWRTLARRYVTLDGVARTEDDIIALLKSRVAPIAEWPEPAAAE